MYISVRPPKVVSASTPLQRYIVMRSTLLRREGPDSPPLSCNDILSDDSSSAMIDEIISASSRAFIRTVAVCDRKQTDFSKAIARSKEAIIGYCMLALLSDGSIISIHVDTRNRDTVEHIHTAFLKFYLSLSLGPTEQNIRWYARHKHGNLLGVRRFEDMTIEKAADLHLGALV